MKIVVQGGDLQVGALEIDDVDLSDQLRLVADEVSTSGATAG